MRYLLICLVCALGVLRSGAQRPVFEKMSSLVRELALRDHVSQKKVFGKKSSPRICAFVRMDSEGERAF